MLPLKTMSRLSEGPLKVWSAQMSDKGSNTSGHSALTLRRISLGRGFPSHPICSMK